MPAIIHPQHLTITRRSPRTSHHFIITSGLALLFLPILNWNPPAAFATAATLARQPTDHAATQQALAVRTAQRLLDQATTEIDT